ncbi:hypothetical protein ACFXTH_006705 [Malus domestica]
MSSFMQYDVLMVIEAISQSNPKCSWIFLNKLLDLQCIMNVSSDEDHGSDFLNFANQVVRLIFNGGMQIFCSEVELHILDPLEVVSSKDF